MERALPLVITRTDGLDVHAVGDAIEPAEECSTYYKEIARRKA